MQARLSPLAASLILGLAWGVWHLPLFFTVGDPRSRMSFRWLMAGILPVSLLFTWLYNNTVGSLLVALLYHTSFNVTGLFLPSPDGKPLIPVLLKWALAAVVVWRYRTPRLSRSTSISGFPQPSHSAE